MKVILINPNSTEAMTVSSIEAAQKAVPEIELWRKTNVDLYPVKRPLKLLEEIILFF